MCFSVTVRILLPSRPFSNLRALFLHQQRLCLTLALCFSFLLKVPRLKLLFFALWPTLQLSTVWTSFLFLQEVFIHSQQTDVQSVYHVRSTKSSTQHIPHKRVFCSALITRQADTYFLHRKVTSKLASLLEMSAPVD